LLFKVFDDALEVGLAAVLGDLDSIELDLALAAFELNFAALKLPVFLQLLN